MTAEEKRLTEAARVANIVLAVGGTFCVLALLRFIYYYSWIHERYFTSLVGPILYYVLPAALATLLFASLRLRPAYKVNLALVYFSASVPIYAVELFLAFANPRPFLDEEVGRRAKAAKKFGVEFDTRSGIEVITDLREKGINAVPAIIPVNLLKEQAEGILKSEITIDGVEVLPLGGIANKVTVDCNENGEYLIYESDEHGFHNPKGAWNAGRIDIAALGDSFTHGDCVPSDKNFIALLRKHYPATLNLGSRSNGPLLMLAALKEYLRAFKPKLVLWFYFEGNDLTDLRKEKDNLLLMRYVESDFTQSLLARQTDIDQALTSHVEILINAGKLRERMRENRENRLLAKLEQTIKLNRLRQRLELVYGEYRYDGEGRSVASEAEIDLFGKVLLQAKAYINSWDGTLCFVYLPEWERYANPAIASKDREQVLTLVKTIGLPVIDIHHAFREQNDPLALFPFR